MAVRTFIFRLDTNIILKIDNNLVTNAVAIAIVNTNTSNTLLSFSPEQLDKLVEAYNTYVKFSDGGRLESVSTV